MTPFLLTLCKHSLLAAAALALAAGTKPLWRERYGARSRCALWLALAVFLLLPVDWSAPNAPVRVEPPAERTLLLSAQRGPSVVRTDELPRRQKTVLSGAEDTSPLPADPPVTFEEAYGTAPDNSAKNVPLTGLLFLLWTSGMTGYIALQIIKYRRFCRLVRRWQHKTMRSDYARLLADECAALGVKQPRLLLCEAVGTPMMTGLFHPVLLLPHEDYEPAALRFILRHELCHLKRHDLAYKLVLTAANAVHWFDPLVYWMLRQADEDVELACDSRATEGMTHAERTTYGETLLAAVQAKIAPVPMTTSFGSTAERLKRRLANVLGGKKRRGLWLAALAVADLSITIVDRTHIADDLCLAPHLALDAPLLTLHLVAQFALPHVLLVGVEHLAGRELGLVGGRERDELRLQRGVLQPQMRSMVQHLRHRRHQEVCVSFRGC